jgi:3-phosphoshikimate 1-carboxyvinyltransferase
VPVLCIDGPTASGKGTLASRLASALGYHYLDSGALYRLTALAAERSGIAWDDEQALTQVARHLPVEFEGQAILLSGDDVSDAIRTEHIGTGASKISVFPAVRAALTALQHGFAKLPGLVADGRDMGTVIFPQAPLKIFLTASAAKRAERRYKQLISKGISAKLDILLADLEARDLRDSSRRSAPLKAAEAAVLLDNSEQSVEQSVEFVLSQWRSKLGV